VNTPQVTALLREAGTSDAAWNELVELFTPQVWAVIDSYRLLPEGEERAARATWAGLAKRLHLPNGPDDVAQWLSTRTHIECQRVADESHRVEVLALTRRRRVVTTGAGLPDRRVNRDRRRLVRGQLDRRGAGGGSGTHSPDVVAARLRHRA
jgi:hypothetical protein